MVPDAVINGAAIPGDRQRTQGIVVVMRGRVFDTLRDLIRYVFCSRERGVQVQTISATNQARDKTGESVN